MPCDFLGFSECIFSKIYCDNEFRDTKDEYRDIRKSMYFRVLFYSQNSPIPRYYFQ